MHKPTHQCVATPPPHQKLNDVVYTPILQPYHDPCRHRAISPPAFTITSVIAAAASWFRNRRIRYLFLLLFSPLILIFLCVTFPFLCAAEVCLRHRLWRKLLVRFSGDDGGDRVRRCEVGCCEGEGEREKGLMHRYLEDQLLLVRSMYECGDEEEPEEDSRRFEDVENIGSSKTPLLLR